MKENAQREFRAGSGQGDHIFAAAILSGLLVVSQRVSVCGGDGEAATYLGDTEIN